jgi:hypothetical protein
MKKQVFYYTNCQGSNIIKILAKHPTLSLEYDFENAKGVGNFGAIKDQKGLPYEQIESCDLFIYQPTDAKHGIYGTPDILTHLKPDCKTISFPYLYNYAFWECLIYADGDYAVGMNKYTHLNHQPITKWKDRGFSFEQIKNMIVSKNFDWNFKERYNHSQQVLREKESICDVKVADFIDQHYKDHLLFYTNNHVSLFLLTHVAKQMIIKLGYDPELLPTNLPHPDYCPEGGNNPEYPIGWFAWNHYKFTFIPEPNQQIMNVILYFSKQIYDGKYINT